MEVLPPCQSSTKLGPQVSQWTWPAAVPRHDTVLPINYNADNTHRTFQQDTTGLRSCQVAPKMQYALLTTCVPCQLYLYVAILLFDVSAPGVGPRAVPGALVVVPLAAGPAVSRRWVCLAPLEYCYLLAANKSHA